MSRTLDPRQAERADELLVDRATVGLADGERDELAALGAEDDDSFDLAAAAIDLATIRPEPVPAALLARLHVAAAGHLAAPTAVARPAPAEGPPAEVTPIRRARTWIVVSAALAAAACAVIWARSRPPEVQIVEVPEVRVVAPTVPPPAEQRAALLAQVRDAVALPWAPTADPAARGVTGDVVWSPGAQRGYMRFVGLAPNSTHYQYQLWIFDKTRDDKFPVDGGLFDVTSAGEIVVPISARIPVRDAVLFAVTIEAPGGVVVSKREHVVVTAAPKST